MLETHRRLYNACLEERKTAYETEGKTVKYLDQSASFTKARAINPFYARTNFSSAQATMRRLDKAYVAFFHRVKAKKATAGFPRFKARDRFDSVEFPSYGDGIKLRDFRIKIQHVGEVPIILHRTIVGLIKTVTVKNEADKWFVIFSCDLPDVPILPTDKPPIGIDVGLEAFLTDSNGRREPNPRYLKDAARRESRRSSVGATPTRHLGRSSR